MKHKAKSLFATLLAVLMIMTMLPTTAFAAAKKVPSKVSITKVTASANSVTVKWKKASNATSYRIYYKKSGAKKWTVVANVSSSKTSYTHKSGKKLPLAAGKKYVYTVRAYNKKSKKWGNYNKKGVSVTVPKKATAAKVPVQSVAISNVNPILQTKGATYKLWSRVLPANATNKTLKWTSSNPKVATVDQNGKVTAVSEGKVYITATAADGSGKSDRALMEVNYHIPERIYSTAITLDKTSVEADLRGERIPITATLTPANHTDWVTWESSDLEVASVEGADDEQQYIVAGEPGTAVLTAHAGENGSVVATCTVTVDYIQWVTFLNQSGSIIDLTGKGTTYQFNPIIKPANTKHNALEWTSSDPSVATVDQNGKVTTVGEGDTTITVTATDVRFPNNPDLTDYCTIRVTIPESEQTVSESDGTENVIIESQAENTEDVFSADPDVEEFASDGSEEFTD